MIEHKAAALLCALALCALPSPLLAEPTRIAVGYVPAGDWLPSFVAKDKGFFDKRSLDVTLTRIALLPNIPPALVAGSLQIGVSTATTLLDAAEGGIDVVVVVGGSRLTAKAPQFSVVARTGVKVADARDLEGKKVGVPGGRGIAEILFRKWLLLNKVQASRVTIVETPFPQMKDLLKGGTVDAVAVLEPFRSRIITDGTGYKVADYVAEVNPDLLGGIWIARADWVNTNPQALRAFREALAEAIAYIGQNADDARAIERKYLGFNSPGFPPFALDVKAADLETYASISKELGFMRKSIDASQLIAK